MSSFDDIFSSHNAELKAAAERKSAEDAAQQQVAAAWRNKIDPIIKSVILPAAEQFRQAATQAGFYANILDYTQHPVLSESLTIEFYPEKGRDARNSRTSFTFKITPDKENQEIDIRYTTAFRPPTDLVLALNQFTLEWLNSNLAFWLKGCLPKPA